MAARVTSRHMEVPVKQWDALAASQFKPLALFFAVGQGGVGPKPYYTFDLRLDGNSTAVLAKALAFFFVMDDYGTLLLTKILKNADIMLSARDEMERLAWGNHYGEWKEAQQERFIEICKDIERREGNVVNPPP